MKASKGNDRLQFSFSGDRLVVKNLPLSMLISFAWNLPINPSPRLAGVPAWAQTERFDIEATVPAGAIPASLSSAAQARVSREMLQRLLESRFQLRMSQDQRELPAYAVVVAKDGPKLERSSIQEPDCARIPEPAQTSDITNQQCHSIFGGQGRGLHARAASIADVAQYVESWTERPVVDKTGLTALYKIETKPWIPLSVGPNPPADAKAESGGALSDLPTLFKVFEDMGLRLETQRAMVDVFHVDHVEEPSEN